MSVEYGINHKSILMELQYFDLCSGVLVQDAMHEYETKLLLCHYINNRNFTLENLNIAIENLELCSNMESDRPAIIKATTLHSEGNLLKQKGIANISRACSYTYVCVRLYMYSSSNVGASMFWWASMYKLMMNIGIIT